MAKTKMAWWLKGLLAVLGAAAICVALMALAVYPRFIQPPNANYPAPTSAAEANLQDLRYLQRAMRINRSFTPAARAAFEQEIARLIERADSLDAATLEMGVAHAVALADDGHTNVRGAAWGLTQHAIPLRMNWFADGLFIVQASPDLAHLLGAQVLAINGADVAELTARLRDYVGGADALRRELAPNLMASPAVLHALGLGSSASVAHLRVRLADGSEHEEDVAAVDAPVMGARQGGANQRDGRDRQWARRFLSPVRETSTEWRHVLDDAETLPLYLSRPDTPYWHTYLDEGRALYVQINRTGNAPEGPTLGAYLRALTAEAQSRGVRDAIVDLRSNTGGDYTLTADFTQRLPRSIPGHIFIVTSGATFSAGLITAARLKHFAGSRGIFVGEPMGDRETFWAEGSRILLPNSGITIGYAAAYHNWRDGCAWREILICHPPNYILGVPAGDLSPDVAAAPTYAAYLRGEDAAMSAIEAYNQTAAGGR